MTRPYWNECLNVNWFLSLYDADEKINDWAEAYNNFRPHSSLSGLTPAEMVAKYKISHGGHNQENDNKIIF